MKHAAVERPPVDPVDAAVEEAIAFCGGDPRAAVRTLLLAYTEVERERDEQVAAMSSGFSRQWHHQRQRKRTGDDDAK